VTRAFRTSSSASPVFRHRESRGFGWAEGAEQSMMEHPPLDSFLRRPLRPRSKSVPRSARRVWRGERTLRWLRRIRGGRGKSAGTDCHYCAIRSRGKSLAPAFPTGEIWRPLLRTSLFFVPRLSSSRLQPGFSSPLFSKETSRVPANLAPLRGLLAPACVENLRARCHDLRRCDATRSRT